MFKGLTTRRLYKSFGVKGLMTDGLHPEVLTWDLPNTKERHWPLDGDV
jgi:hypothetical protein